MSAECTASVAIAAANVEAVVAEVMVEVYGVVHEPARGTPGIEDSSPVRTWNRLGSSRQEPRAESSPLALPVVDLFAVCFSRS